MQNYMGNALAGFQAGRQMRQDMETQRAMGALLQNPDDPQAMARLGQFNPQAAMQMQQQQQQRAMAEIEAKRDKILMGAQIFRAAKAKNPNAPDEQVYASILPMLPQIGIDPAGLPQPGDPQLPQYLQSIMAIADGLKPQDTAQAPSFIREADMLGVPRDRARELWEQKQGIVVVNGIPHMASPSSGPPPSAIEYLRANPHLAPQFEQKYGPGSAAQVLGGQTGSAPSGPFQQ